MGLLFGAAPNFLTYERDGYVTRETFKSELVTLQVNTMDAANCRNEQISALYRNIMIRSYERLMEEFDRLATKAGEVEEEG